VHTIQNMATHPKDKLAFSGRFNQLLDAVGAPSIGQGRQGYLSLTFDVSDKGGRKWIQGESIPRYEMLLRIVEKYKHTGVTVEWLLTGDEQLSPFTHDLDAAGRIIKTLRMEAWKLPVIDWGRVGEYMAQANANSTEYAMEWVNTTNRPLGKTFALRVVGDAMECLFSAGMVITVEPDLPAQPGDYVLAEQANGSTTFKQLIEDGGVLYLKPLNARYPIQQLGDGHIIGVVREAVIKFR